MTQIRKMAKNARSNNLYIANSAAFIAEREVYKKNKDRLCKNTFPILSRDISGFDLDNKKDFQCLRQIFKKISLP